MEKGEGSQEEADGRSHDFISKQESLTFRKRKDTVSDIT
jgi:hypothetical protein